MNKSYKSKDWQQLQVAHLSTMYAYVGNFQSVYLLSILFSMEYFQRKALKISSLFFEQENMGKAKWRPTSFSDETPQC